jgi:hypothetical protein
LLIDFGDANPIRAKTPAVPNIAVQNELPHYRFLVRKPMLNVIRIGKIAQFLIIGW